MPCFEKNHALYAYLAHKDLETSKRAGPQTLYLESKAGNAVQNNKSVIYELKLRKYWPNYDSWFNNKLRDLDEHLRPWIIKNRGEKNVEAEVTNTW